MFSTNSINFLQDICVERFVMGVNGAMYRQQEHERLSAVVSRIECYDAIDCNNDEAEKVSNILLEINLVTYGILSFVAYQRLLVS